MPCLYDNVMVVVMVVVMVGIGESGGGDIIEYCFVNMGIGVDGDGVQVG